MNKNFAISLLAATATSVITVVSAGPQCPGCIEVENHTPLQITSLSKYNHVETECCETENSDAYHWAKNKIGVNVASTDVDKWRAPRTKVKGEDQCYPDGWGPWQIVTDHSRTENWSWQGSPIDLTEPGTYVLQVKLKDVQAANLTDCYPHSTSLELRKHFLDPQEPTEEVQVVVTPLLPARIQDLPVPRETTTGITISGFEYGSCQWYSPPVKRIENHYHWTAHWGWELAEQTPRGACGMESGLSQAIQITWSLYLENASMLADIATDIGISYSYSTEFSWSGSGCQGACRRSAAALYREIVELNIQDHEYFYYCVNPDAPVLQGVTGYVSPHKLRNQYGSLACVKDSASAPPSQFPAKIGGAP